MAWLIGHRAKIKGQIERLKRLEGALPERIRVAQAELAAIDAVFSLHEVKVDPAVIKGSKPKRAPAAAHGEMTRHLLRTLREAKGKEVYTAELALGFARLHAVDLGSITHSDLMSRVGKRLRDLSEGGLVRRHHPAVTTAMGSWSLMVDPEDQELPHSSASSSIGAAQ